MHGIAGNGFATIQEEISKAYEILAEASMAKKADEIREMSETNLIRILQWHYVKFL